MSTKSTFGEVKSKSLLRMKRLSISVAIACDRAAGNFQQATTIAVQS